LSQESTIPVELDNTGNSTVRVHSACPHDCPSTCALEIEKLDSRTIGRVYGADNPYTAGVVCAKVARYAERIHHPDRLATPLLRKNSKSSIGEFEAVSWESALDLLAERFQHIISEYGAEAIWPYHYAGTMGLVQRDGIERLRNCLGTSLQHGTFCTALSNAGWKAGTGSKRGTDVRTMVDSELIVVWGGNPVNTQVNLMHHIASARKNGAKLVVIDPYRTGTAKQADTHLMLRPGTDGALACAVMHVLINEDYADTDYLQQYTDWSTDFAEHLNTRTPQWAAEITGLSVAQIVEFAQLYGSVKKSFLRAGYGFSRSRNGAASMHAVSCLPAITGAWKHHGGGALYGHSEIYNLNTAMIQGADRANKNARVLDQSRIGQILTGNKADLQGGPPVMAMFIQNTNPLAVAPESLKVKQGLSRDDLFTCVHEQFLTDTAQMADLVLPATMFLEHDDMYVASGHTYLQVTKKVIEPYAETRTNHKVLCDLAARLGLEHPGFNMTEWELMEHTLKESALPDAETIYNNHWHDCAMDFEDANFLNGFGTPDGKFHFQPDWSRVGPNHQSMPKYADHFEVTDEATDDYPMRLVAAPARQFLNTSFTETQSSVKRESRPTLKIHPEDLKALSLTNEQRVSVESKCGAIVVHAQSFDGVQRGVVIIESIWPNKYFEGGVGVNTLVSSEPGYPNGGACFHDTAVRVAAA